MNNQIEQAYSLFPTLEFSKEAIVDKEFLTAIDSIAENLPENSKQKAKDTITKWVANILLVLDEISNTEEVEFKNNFKNKLIEFIKDKDHGILHSYYVYLGMLKLANLEKVANIPDNEIQLLALFHDFFQILPVRAKRNITHRQKKDHAKLIAGMVKIFARKLGFQNGIKEAIYGLRYHDASYNKKLADKIQKFSPPLKLLHDADKLFGGILVDEDTDISTVIEKMAQAMLERNYLANRGPKGSYLLRTELSEEIRDLFEYSHRCVTDSLAVIKRELDFPMCTQSAKAIIENRKKAVKKAIKTVYGRIFEETKELLQKYQQTPHLFKVKIVGMDQDSLSVGTTSNLKELITHLYNEPIHIQHEERMIAIYGQDQARGLKLELTDEKDQVYYIDPSIAKFCFKKDGKKEFLTAITEALLPQSDKPTTS